MSALASITSGEVITTEPATIKATTIKATTTEPSKAEAATTVAATRNWYALYTVARHEKSVAEQMERQGVACFLPLYRSVRRWKDRRKELLLVLFPGYVFVQMTPENRLRVLQARGAVRIVSVNGQPAALPHEEIERLRERIRAGKIEPHPYLCAGRRVRVRSGPLEGLEGIVQRRKDCCRVIFSIELIMRSVAVEVDEGDLVPA
jgi:transcription antitermination factor NusG